MTDPEAPLERNQRLVCKVARAFADNHADQQDLLYAAIRRLADLDRSLVLMHLDGCSYQEIGAVLSLSESNVGARLSRVRNAISAGVTTDWVNASEARCLPPASLPSWPFSPGIIKGSL